MPYFFVSFSRSKWLQMKLVWSLSPGCLSFRLQDPSNLISVVWNHGLQEEGVTVGYACWVVKQGSKTFRERVTPDRTKDNLSWETSMIVVWNRVCSRDQDFSINGNNDRLGRFACCTNTQLSSDLFCFLLAPAQDRIVVIRSFSLFTSSISTFHLRLEVLSSFVP